MLISGSFGNCDSPRLLHGSPLHIMVDVLGALQPFSQHGSGVVPIMVCCCPETSSQSTQDVIQREQTINHMTEPPQESFTPPVKCHLLNICDVNICPHEETSLLARQDCPQGCEDFET